MADNGQYVLNFLFEVALHRNQCIVFGIFKSKINFEINYRFLLLISYENFHEDESLVRGLKMV